MAVLFTSTNPNYSNGSASTAILITAVTPSVVVVSSNNPSTFGGSVTFIATVSSAAGTPTGTVQFVVDGANFGATVTLSGGTANGSATTTLSPGEHVVTAVYSGDADFLASTSLFLIQEVNNPLSSIAVTPANPSVFVGGTKQFVATGTFTDTTSAILPTGGTWAVENSMTNGVRAPMSAGSNGLLYYFGGQDSGGAENYVQTYNPATGAWSSGASMTTARYEGVAVAPGNGLIYVIGGWNNSAPSSVVEAYDPVGNTWKSEASLGHPSGCSEGGAINGLIYVLTGCDGSASPSNEFDVYNPATKAWTSLTKPSHNHSGGAGGVMGGKLYVAGGYDTSNTAPTGITEVYDPQTGTWSTLSPMSASLAGLGSAVITGSSDSLYVLGGVDGSNNLQTSIYEYTVGSGWSELPSSLSTATSNMGVVALDSEIFAAGGATSGSPYSNATQAVDTDNVTWASDTTSVATIDPNAGLATGASAGTANISATSAEYSVSGSTPLTVTKQNQTITFTGPGPQTYGAAPVAISATDSANLQVTFTSTTPSVCTVSTGALSGSTTAGTATILSTGLCSITASQGGNADYLPASPVTASFTVNTAALTITANSTSKTYGQTVTFAGTEFTTSGLVNSDSVTSVTLSSTGAAVTATVTAPGPTYPIVASNAVGSGLSNYTITYQNGTLMVNTAPLTITASSTSKTYGQTATLTAFTTTPAALYNSDSVTSLTLTSTGAAVTATVTAPGPTYPIVASSAVGSGLGNYSITYQNGTLTVNLAPLTITASSTSKTYGQTATLSGFTTLPATLYNSDSVTSVTLSSTGAPATATVTAPGPTYPIVPSSAVGSGLGNYAITYQTGTLTVNAALASVTPNAATKVYGTADPTLTGTLTGFLAADGVTATYSRTPGNNVGTYSISATLSPTAVLGNYNITYNTANFTITQANASVTPNAATKVYGTADPTLTATLSGFLASDGVTATYTRTSGNTVGAYTISATLGPTAVLSNYNITYNTASFTITPATLTITASSGTFAYRRHGAQHHGQLQWLRGH